MGSRSLVALVGRPNVGKSTLFNRLVAQRQAITFETPGVTRDRHYGEVDWCGRSFTLIDTGGYLAADADGWSGLIREQIGEALAEAAVLLFMLDIQTGLCADDWAIAALLRRLQKPVLLVANKADTHALGREAVAFHELGLGLGLYEVSAMNGSGSGDLLDAVLEQLAPATEADEEEKERLPRFALVGRPNVGKSTLLNALLGTSRSLVSAEAGTTRDALLVDYNRYGHRVQFIDTAGIRRRARTKEPVEFYATMRAIASMEACDVCILLVDASEGGLSSQDLHLLALAARRHKGLLLAVNKWDCIEKNNQTQNDWRKQLTAQLGILAYAQVAFISAQEKIGLIQLIRAATAIDTARRHHISTARLNDELLVRLAQQPPPSHRGLPVRLTYATQLRKDYPHFVIFSNRPQHIKVPYIRFIERVFRECFDLKGVPVVISLRSKHGKT